MSQIDEMYNQSKEAEPMPFPDCAAGPVMLPFYQFDVNVFYWPPVKQKRCGKLDNTCHQGPCYAREIENCKTCVIVFDVVNDVLSNQRYEYVNYVDQKSCSCATCEDLTESECLSQKRGCPNFTDHTIHTNCYWDGTSKRKLKCLFV